MRPSATQAFLTISHAGVLLARVDVGADGKVLLTILTSVMYCIGQY
jgi:hypothetical protein